MTSFSRTMSGKVNRSLFHTGVVIWVEGDDDLLAYDWLIRGLPCRLEEAGGRPECERLASELIDGDLDYLVIMDGDYRVLDKKRSAHRRVVLLQRYSIENYLLEEGCVVRLCDLLKPPADPDVGGRYQDWCGRLSEALREAVVLDAASVRNALPDAVFPKHADALLKGKRSSELDQARLDACCASPPEGLTSQMVAETRRLVTQWCSERPLLHLLRGHLVFGLIRRFISSEIRRRGGKWSADNRSLLILLCAEVWNGPLPDDHRKLRRKVRTGVRAVSAMRDAV